MRGYSTQGRHPIVVVTVVRLENNREYFVSTSVGRILQERLLEHFAAHRVDLRKWEGEAEG